jgi:hypothetical protein
MTNCSKEIPRLQSLQANRKKRVATNNKLVSKNKIQKVFNKKHAISTTNNTNNTKNSTNNIHTNNIKQNNNNNSTSTIASNNDNNIAKSKDNMTNTSNNTNNNQPKCTTALDKFLQKETPIIKSTQQLIHAVNNSNIIPSTVPINDDIGKLGLMWPRGLAKDHRSAQLLDFFSDEGCPADCGEDWTRDHIEKALQRGNHQSANSKKAQQYLRQQTKEKIAEGFAKVVKYGDIMGALPAKLKISPVAMVPHKSRLFRCILDLSFRLRIK